jgi:phosphoribosyl-dephospho-CoA transferase
MAPPADAVIHRPHDLLHLTEQGAVSDEAPAWVRHAVARTPWVVVRRSRAPEGFVAVGVRGANRSQRYPMMLPHSMFSDVIAPEDLAAVGAERDAPALRGLAVARAHLDACAMPWGPTGSVCFELATGAATVTPDSDLDVLVRAAVLTPRVMQGLGELHERLRTVSVRVDCQVETAGGAIALGELMSASSRVLVKTSAGPDLMTRTELLA